MRPEDMPRLNLTPSQVGIIVELPEGDSDEGVGDIYLATNDGTSRKGSSKDAVIVVDGLHYSLIDVLERAGIA